MNTNKTLSVNHSLKGQNVLVTGVTGFLGKAIIEKVLREIPQIGQIYLLIRGNGKYPNAHARFQGDVLSSNIFDSLRAQLGGVEFNGLIDRKVTVVDGELTASLLGMNRDKFKELGQGLDLIINGAASVNFREPLDQALTINTLCLNNIADLAKLGSEKVTPVLHISTCYVHGFNQGIIHEKIAEPASQLITKKPSGLYEIDDLLRSLQAKVAKVCSRYQNEKERESKLIKLGIKESRRYGWNDTYTFSKWLGEQLLLQELGQKNITILRPSIIESAWQSPAPGWVEGVKVADALIYAYAKGRVNIFPGDNSGVLDVIPVDLVANAALLSGAELRQSSGDYRIYQCCSGQQNPITLGSFVKYLQEEAERSYQDLPKLFANKPSDNFKTVSLQKFKLYMLALKSITWLKTSSGRLMGSTKASTLMRKVSTTAELAIIFGFYTAAKYRFDATELEKLHGRFSDCDQQRFIVNSNCFDWKYYLQKVHLFGLHKYALANKPELKKKNITDSIKIKKAA